MNLTPLIARLGFSPVYNQNMSRRLPKHDHEGIRQVARDIESAMEGNRVDDFFEAVDLMFHTVVTHIRSEDSYLGIYHEIEHAVPRLQYYVRDLREQHEEILKQLNEARALTKEEFSKAKSIMKNCLALLHHHERGEDNLIHEAYYLELGSPGA